MLIKRYPANYKPTGADLNKLQQIIQQESIVSIPGHNLIPTNAGKLLNINEGMLPTRLIRITDYTLISGQITAWTYDIEVIKLKADLTIVGTGFFSTAFNLTEVLNTDAAGLQGNGVDTSAASWPALMEIQPAPVGLLRIAHKLDGLSDFGYVFEYENGNDGECS